MPYKTKKVENSTCVYKKTTGKKVGCTKGSVKKYLAALHMHAQEGIMMKKFYVVCQILNESRDQEETSTLSPEEKAKRARMVKRMAALGIAAGLGVTAAELMAHKSSRASLLRALKAKKLGTKVRRIGKQVWKPMAIGAGADVVVEPTNVKIAQAMEDRRKKQLEKGK